MTYYCQMVWYMGIIGFKKGIMYAMIEKINFDENKESDYFLKTYHVEFKQEDFDYMIEKVKGCWEKVQKNEWNEFKIKLEV